MVDKKKLYPLFKGQGAWTAFYTRTKFKICPLLPIEPLLPPEGRVLDLGCGNGLFAAILKLGAVAGPTRSGPSRSTESRSRLTHPNISH